MQDFGKFTARNDPFLHFYETFLAEYNPTKRKARGVWYTPEPVVNFIVRAVDDVLKTEFNLPRGIADTSKIQIDWDTGQNDPKTGKPLTIKKDVHRVQILDPATGTGTFLAEAIKQIAAQVKDIAPGMWSGYVEENLIPRLHGFELLMASYAMCHLKLDMMLTDMGYKPSSTPPRLGVYLTNSLEEGERVEQTLPFARWLSEEAKGANTIKRDTPIMCVIGNPPYNSSSTNNGAWINRLIEPYKAELGEQKVNLNDDYIKFIRLGENYIEKNGFGVLAMITNNSFLDGITQRHMRRHLRRTFDAIYVLNLHGDIRTDSGSTDKDENVFDITQGVSICVMVKRNRGNVEALAQTFYTDLFGKRAAKYAYLFDTGNWKQAFQVIDADAPNYRFRPSVNPDQDAYEKGFPLNTLAQQYSSGVQTKRDGVCVAFNHSDMEATLADFASLPIDEIQQKYDLPADGRDWTIKSAKEDVRSGNGRIIPFLYKPFDIRKSYFSGKTKGFVAYPRREVMANIVGRENVSMLFNRQTVRDYFSYAGVTNHVCNHGTFYLGNRGQDYCFPLYLYPEEGTLETERRVNFDPKIYAEIKAKAGLQPSPPLGGEGRTAQPDGERGESADGGAYAHPSGIAHGSGPLSPSPSPPEGGEGSDAEIKAKAGLQPSPSTCDGEVAVGAIAATDGGASNGDGPSTTPSARSPSILSAVEGQVDGEDYPDELRVFDYIYGVLHAPDYRATYAQFLKIDFPRIPYPPSPEIFAHVAEKGGQLRRLHLMEDAAIGATPYPFSGAREDGDDNVVEKPAYVPLPQAGGEYGRVHINPDQYFENVPALAWEFHIGGYQPAQKWLKDRKGRALSFDDVVHYQKIIKILTETDRIMREIILPL
jgi:hypothetical protein